MKKTYEGLFIFLDTMNDEAVAQAMKIVPTEIEKANGKVIDSVIMGRRQFSRPLHKKESGHYLQVIFELDGAQVAELRGRLRLHDEVFRAQIVSISEADLALFNKRKAAKTVEEPKHGVTQ